MTNKLLFFVLLPSVSVAVTCWKPIDVHITGERGDQQKHQVDRKQNAKQKNNPLCHDPVIPNDGNLTLPKML